MGHPFPLKIAHSHGGCWPPSNTWFLEPITSPQPKRHLDQFSRFAEFTSVTDRQTDHATRSVTIGRIYVRNTAMWPDSINSISVLEHLACQKTMDKVLAWLSVWSEVQVIDLCMVQLMSLHPTISCFSKIQNGLSLLYQLTPVALKKWPLNKCCCYCSLVCSRHDVLGTDQYFITCLTLSDMSMSIIVHCLKKSSQL